MRNVFHKANGGRAKVYCRDGSYAVWTRVLARNLIGRELKRNEIVHHVDRNPGNDSHNNLVICTMSYHREFLHTHVVSDKRTYIISNKKIQEIRDAWFIHKMPQPRIAKLFGVTRGYVSAVVNNRTRR